MTETQTPAAAEYVDPFPGRKGSDRIVETCSKCGGTGYYVGPTGIVWDGMGRGVNEPLCFDCGGKGTTSVLVSSRRAWARAQAREAAQIAEQNARRVALLAAWEAAGYAELAAQAETTLTGLRSGDPLATALRQAADDLNLLTATEADAQAVRDALAAIVARDAALVEVPAGRQAIEGVVLTVKSQEGYMGASVLKMLVEVEAEVGSFKVWGTFPSSLYGLGVEKGSRVAMTATLEPREPGFGFYSRPTKARLV
jgi:hypothetical protein